MRAALLLATLAAGCLDYEALHSGTISDLGAGDGSDPAGDMDTRAPDADSSADLAPPPACGATIPLGYPFEPSGACCAPASPEYGDGGQLLNGTCGEPGRAVCLVFTSGVPVPPYCQACGQVNGDACCPPPGTTTSVDLTGLTTCTAGLRCLERSEGDGRTCRSEVGCGAQGEACCEPGGGGSGVSFCEIGLGCLENNPGERRCGPRQGCGGQDEPCCWIDAAAGWGCEPGATTCQSDTSSPNGTRCK